MTRMKPFCLTVCKATGSFISYISAGIHYWLISFGFLKVPVYLFHVPNKRFTYLRDIWYTRTVKRILSVLVRSPLRSHILQIVNFNIPLPAHSGCIIVICHTPWKRLLVQWCLEKEFAFIISSYQLSGSKKMKQYKAAGFRELRNMVKCLRSNGRVVLAADVFNQLKNCPVHFLGKDLNASLVPARLAKIAGVPLIATIPALDNQALQFIPGPQFDLKKQELNSPGVIREIISFLETEIRKRPSIWPPYVY